MPLSNPRLFFMLAVICILLNQACSPTHDNASKAVVRLENVKGDFPFSTKEPSIYQADLIINERLDNRRFIAHNSEKWRLDVYKQGRLATTQLRLDKLFLIDHTKRIYVSSEPGNSLDPSLSDSEFNFFPAKTYREFDDLGWEGKLRKYRVSEGYSKEDTFIYIDEAIGMMVKQEFKSRDPNPPAVMIYELKNLKFDTDDGLFAVPNGYQKVSLEEYKKVSTRN